MIVKFRIDKDTTENLDRITSIYNFRKDTLTGRIAFAISVNKGKKFEDDFPKQGQVGREYSPTSNVFGNLIDDTDNFIIYKAVLDQHYNKSLTEDEFVLLFKNHLIDGIQRWNEQLNSVSIPKGEHIQLLMNLVKSGLNMRMGQVRVSSLNSQVNDISEFKEPLSFIIGKSKENEEVEIHLNDLREFDNRNIAIAGMAGSGKTQLIKDVLFQMSKNSSNKLKFIFFDYKGEGNPEQLKPFLDATNCSFIDIIKDEGIKFNPLLSIHHDKKQRPFSIKAFVDTIATFVPNVGVTQKNILTNVLTELFEEENASYPTIEKLFEGVKNHYDEVNRKPDTLYAGIQDLTTNIFDCNAPNLDIFNSNLYLNLPPALSDTLRQLIVFLLLRYIYTFFSSTNDCQPDGHIFPLRYVIVIDEAHIYLKNKNARKALEELLRLLRSKGVVVIMLSQGVEDYKTKDFDFASQIKLPICLNVQNKDYKLITAFLGTPQSKYKMEAEIQKLHSGMGLINFGEPKIFELNQFWKTIQSTTEI